MHALAKKKKKNSTSSITGFIGELISVWNIFIYFSTYFDITISEQDFIGIARILYLLQVMSRGGNKLLQSKPN